MASKWWTVFKLVGIVLIALAGSLTIGLADASAQNSTLAEAKDLYDRGQNDAGLAKLQELIGQDIDQETAFELLGEVDYGFWLDLLVLGGDHEKAAMTMLDRARLEEKERRADAEAIAALVAQLASDDVAERNAARLALSADHGSFAVPAMLTTLSQTNSSEYKINLLYSLTQLGSEAVMPLAEALRSSDEDTRTNAIIVLGNIKDSRAAGYLQRHAQLGGIDAAETELVNDALSRMGHAGGNARDTLMALANRYLVNDPGVVRDVQSTRPVWSWTDDGLAADVVPLYLYHLIMAEKACYEALEAAPGDEEVLATLANTMLKQKAALAAAGGEGAVADRVNAAYNLATAGGTDVMREALRRAMADESPDVVIEGIEALATTSSGAALTDAIEGGLDHEDKRVRYAAAVALAKNNASNLGANAGKVVDTLIQAVGEESVRTVVVIDSNADTRNAVLGAVHDLGMFGVGAGSGIGGLQTAKGLPGSDLFVIRADLADVSADKVLRSLADDFRTQNVPVVLLASEGSKVTVQNNYGSRVAGVITGADTAGIQAAVGEDKNENRQRALAAASKAAAALHLVAHAGSVSLDGAVPALIGTLDRPDSVRKDAIGALGFIGDARANAGLVKVLSNTGNAADVRAAAAVALGQISGSTGSVDGEVYAALAEALTDDDSSVAAAAAKALGMAALSVEQRNQLLSKKRPGTSGLSG